MIDRAIISEIHKRVVNGLDPSREGDRYPGLYRKHPAISDLRKRSIISNDEGRILEFISKSKQQYAQANEMREALDVSLKKVKSHTLSRLLQPLKDKRMIAPIEKKSRRYGLIFTRGPLTAHVVNKLAELGFFPSDLFAK